MRTANWTAGVLNLLPAGTPGAPAVALAGSVTYTALINGGPGGIDLFLQDDNTGQVNFMMLDSQITLPDPVCTSVSNQFSCVQNLSGTLLVGNGSRDYSLPFPIGHDIQEV